MVVKLPDKELCPKCKTLQEVKCVDEPDQKVIRCCKCGWAIDWLYKEETL
jgi:Zn ribbon nucleic-acid-binding protein